ncbi:hypothetical protein [Actinoplanes sp. N902-109]|uniref:hypothetical protein n=1 Tax=Actinoplanes sp. (strain N902-109) TaxID=649831 RepID=UPI0003296661|nr:hypothetical protein [Actinoplanes sp. N902-109]AGL13849.1 hypothetical protein L083_0339 [Actinoplanes sp. N902-109]
MPIPDPASLNVALTISGLSNAEATVVVNNLPVGSTASIEVTKPAIGSKRFRIAAEGLSIQGAKDVATATFLHLERIAKGETLDDPETQAAAIRSTALCPERVDHHLMAKCGSCSYTQLVRQAAPDNRPNASGGAS